MTIQNGDDGVLITSTFGKALEEARVSEAGNPKVVKVANGLADAYKTLRSVQTDGPGNAHMENALRAISKAKLELIRYLKKEGA